MYTASLQKKATSLFSLTMAILLSLGLLTGLLLFTSEVQAQSGVIYYVDRSAAGAATGLNWTNAYTDLQDALITATWGAEIWVAEGVYTPGITVSDTFSIPSGVAVYGGFPTGGGNWAERDWEANPTILSGDIDGDDTNTDGNYIAEDWLDIQGDNAYHVVFMDGTTTPITESTRLDGFTLTAGQANVLSYPDGNGGGLFCEGVWGECSPTLTNVTFSGNFATRSGGGMYADTSYYGASDPVLADVLFSGNYAPSGGGIYINGYWWGTSDPVLTGVLFSGNKASDGGGIYLSALISATCNASLTNVTFQGNYAPSGSGMVNDSDDSGTARSVLTNVTFAGNDAYAGGAIHNLGTPNSTSSISLTNAILWGNRDQSIAGVQIRNEHGSLALSHTLIQSSTQAISNTGITTVTYGAGILTDDPRFVAPLAATAAPTTTGNYRLQAGSPAIDAGDNAAITVTTDLDGSARFVDGDGDGNAVVDMGAYETRVDLALAKTADPDPAVAGIGLTYTLVITNQGTIPATALLSDTLPPSVTLRTLDQTDNVESEFNAGTHDNTTWFDPAASRLIEAYLTLSDPLQATGVFTSRVFDAGNVVPWETLSWTPRRPTDKPLPDNGAAETAYALGDVNMVGNRVLLHLDDTGAPFADTSGHGNDGACTTCPATGAGGRFNNALAFDGVDDVVTVPDAHDPARYALELWVYPETVADTSFILRTDAVSGTDHLYSHLLGIRDGRFLHLTRAGGAERAITGTTVLSPNTWYHVVGTAEGGGELKLYVNGQEEARAAGLGALWTGGDRYVIGSSYGVTGTAPFHGRLDEVVVYSRTLSAAEVTDHYLRGALQLDFEVRACDQPDCSGAIWHGPYSEEHNTGLDLPAVTFFPPLPDARYAQYRVTLTTDDPDYTPALHRVALGPDHYDVTAEPPSQCVATSGAFTCTLDVLPAGSVATVTARTRVHPSALGPITNTAFVTTTGELTPTDNVVTATTVVTSHVILVLDKYDDDRDLPYDYEGKGFGMADPVNPGSPMTYTLFVQNAGPSTAWDVTVTDTLPITPALVMPPEGWSCATTGRALTCIAPSLPLCLYDVIVITGAAPTVSGTITNTAGITAAGSIVYPGPHQVDTITTTIIPLADLALAKTAAPDPVDPGATVTYTLTITNNGPYTATGVVLTDTPDARLTGITPLDPACGVSGGAIVCTLPGILTPTHSVSFQIAATAPLSGLLENVARATSQIDDPDPDNNDAHRYVAVRPVADLSIAKRATPDPVDAASTLTYTIVVSNAGPVDAGALTTTISMRTHRNIRVPIAGAAQPYPSSLWVNSVPGLVRQITVTLYGLQHTYPADLVALLVGPSGQSTVLMANAGGGTDAGDLTLTFHDTGMPLPLGDPLSMTTYRPTNHSFGESLPAPAPAGPYGSGFSPFYGRSPNGVWRLYLYDTFASDEGRIAGGWGLELVAVTTDTVTLSDTLPAGVTGATPHMPGWTCTTDADVICTGERLRRGASATMTLPVTAPLVPGPIVNTAAITSTLADPDLTDNTARITTTVHGTISGTIYLPLVTRRYAAAPDLVVERIDATANGVQVVIRNQGSVPATEEFWVDVYVDPNPVPSEVNQIWQHVSDQGIAWGITVDLAAGQTLTLTVGDAFYWAALSDINWPLAPGTPIYAQADAAHAATDYGAILEDHEITGGPYNNIALAVVQPGGSAADVPDAGRRTTGGHLPPRP